MLTRYTRFAIFLALLLSIGLILFSSIPTASARSVEGAVEYFASLADAEKYIRQQFAGGDIKELQSNSTQLLVLSKFGSGVPEISISLYLPEYDGWRLAATFRPWQSGTMGESHHIEIQGKQVLIIGRQSEKAWVLWEDQSPQ